MTTNMAFFSPGGEGGAGGGNTRETSRLGHVNSYHSAQLLQSECKFIQWFSDYLHSFDPLVKCLVAVECVLQVTRIQKKVNV